MKKRIFIVAAVISVALASCKKDGETKTEETKPAVNERFSVELDVIAAQKDDFSVYYTEDKTINFTGEMAVWNGVKGLGTSEKIVFNLPEAVIPTNIRFDFGLNKDQGDITLEKFKLDFYGKSFESRGSDFFKYFIPNDSVQTRIDSTKGTITFLKNPKKYATPFFYPQQAVLDEIAKITK